MALVRPRAQNRGKSRLCLEMHWDAHHKGNERKEDYENSCGDAWREKALRKSKLKHKNSWRAAPDRKNGRTFCKPHLPLGTQGDEERA